MVHVCLLALNTLCKHRIVMDFFERRRFNRGDSLLHKNLALPRKRKVSQDLMALQKVSTFHSGLPASTGIGYRAPVKAVDLDRFKSCTQHFKEVDIGPLSPTHAQSRLLLMDCKGDNLKKTSATETSLDASNNSIQMIDHFSLGAQDGSIPNKKETFVKPDIRPFSFRKTHESDKTISFDSKPNSYVSENFPFTPVTKPETSKHRRGNNRHQRDSHAAADKGKHKSKDRAKRYMYTSTPYDAVLNHSYMDKEPLHQTLNLNISPICVQNLSKTGSKNSILTSTATLTSYAETSQTDQLSIDATGDWNQDNLINERIGRNQNKSNNFENGQLLQANNSNNDRQQSCSRQIARLSKHYFDPSLNLSSNLNTTNDLLNLSLSQYHAGLNQLKHAHAKKPTITERSLSLDELRQQTSTPGNLHQSAVDPYESRKRPLVLNKPNFQDFDEEFRYTPYKEISYHACLGLSICSTPCKNPKLSSSSYRTPVKRVDISGQAVSSNDLRPRSTLCNTINLIKETPKQPDIMNLYREQKKTEHTGSSNERSIQEECSPKIADPFPSLPQTKISDTSSAEKIQAILEERSDEVSNLMSKNHADMNDVLKEMDEMETEENIQLEASNEKDKVFDDTVIYEDANQRTSMSYEADNYFESEEHEIQEDRWAETIENQHHKENNNIDEHEVDRQNVHNNKIEDTNCNENIAVAVDKSDEFSPDIIMEDNSKDVTQVFKTSQGFDVNTFCQYYPPANEIDELENNLPEYLEKNLDDSSNTFSEDRVTVEQSSRKYVDLDARSCLNKTHLGNCDGRDVEGKNNCTARTSVLDKYAHKLEETNIENWHQFTRISSPKDLDKDLELNNTKKADTMGNAPYQKIGNDFQQFQQIQTSESETFNIHVLATNSKVITPNGLNVQDPEVSSGINRGIQCCIKQSLVDKGTSPIIMTSTNFTDIGIQCDGTFKKFDVQCVVELNNTIMAELDSNSQQQEEAGRVDIKNIIDHSKEE